MSIKEFHAKLNLKSDSSPLFEALRKIRQLDREAIVALDFPVWDQSRTAAGGPMQDPDQKVVIRLVDWPPWGYQQDEERRAA